MTTHAYSPGACDHSFGMTQRLACLGCGMPASEMIDRLGSVALAGTVTVAEPGDYEVFARADKDVIYLRKWVPGGEPTGEILWTQYRRPDGAYPKTMCEVRARVSLLAGDSVGPDVVSVTREPRP